MGTSASGSPAGDNRSSPRTHVTCSCPVCGVMKLPLAAFTLVVAMTSPDRSFYQFVCERCGEVVTKGANERVIEGLMNRGIPVQRMPAEALEERGRGSAIGADDLLDLLLALGDDAVIAAAMDLLMRVERHRLG